MGTYSSATTAIGYKFSKNGFYENKEKPSCSHTHDPDAIFCKTCGIKIGMISSRHNHEIENDFYELYNHLPKDYVFEYNDTDCWIGFGASVDNQEAERFGLTKSFDEIKRDIQDMLRPFIDAGCIQLDEEEFGVWTIMMGH